MKGLSVAGTAAMFLVGGGILTHGIHAVGEWIATQPSKPRRFPAPGWCSAH